MVNSLQPEVERAYGAREGVDPTEHFLEYLFLPIYWMQDAVGQALVLGLFVFLTLFLVQVAYAVYAGRARLRRVWRH